MNIIKLNEIDMAFNAELTEYNKNGQITHIKFADGKECWYDYDDTGNNIHYKTSDGYEDWRDYDERGNLSHYRDFEGKEIWYEHDSENVLVGCKNAYGQSWRRRM